MVPSIYRLTFPTLDLLLKMLIFLLTLLLVQECCIFQSGKCRQMKVLELLMQNVEEMNIYTEAHMGTLADGAAESSKMQQTYPPPFFCQLNQPLKHSQISCLFGHQEIHSLCLEKSLLKTPKAPSIWKCGDQKSCKHVLLQSYYVIRRNSQLSVYPQTKAAGRLKEKLVRLLRGPPSRGTNCFAPLHYTTLTWLKSYINYSNLNENIALFNVKSSKCHFKS